MEKPNQTFTLVQLQSFAEFIEGIKHIKELNNNKEDFHITHLDFNLFAVTSMGLAMLDTLHMKYSIFADHIPYVNLLDFYDHDHRYKFSTEQFDFTPDYNSLLIEYNIEELTVRDLEVFNYNF